MTQEPQANPAVRAAEEARQRILSCIDKQRDFLVEAGAGAGKTYSLIETLSHLIATRGHDLLRRSQRVACITFTNVAREEIESRTDRHPAILSSTIHAFCWLLIKDFQAFLRGKLPSVNNWSERLEPVGGIGARSISYDDLGYRAISETNVSLGHNDVLSLTVELMNQPKFRTILTNRFPILLIDEYQDTDKMIAESLLMHLVGKEEGPLIGFFGDHWQKIYGTGCGKIEHPALTVIGKESNFRSVPAVVDVLKRMRPDLPQEVTDPKATGSAAVYHTNNWVGERRTGQHWAGDLPPDVAQRYLDDLMERLRTEGWEFSENRTKILLLTHKVLADRQGYAGIADAFPFNESYVKKEDQHIRFLVDTVEPVCVAYVQRQFGEMFAALGSHTPPIQSPRDKATWAQDMDRLIDLRKSGTIGAVMEHLARAKRPKLPESVEQREKLLAAASPEEIADSSSLRSLQKLKNVAYEEIQHLSYFLDEHTPFSTKHGVKGAEFENVLVVFGRGWNLYNFGQFLEWAADSIPKGKEEAFERNRNLFYVVCSRPKKRLSLLFTQEVSPQAQVTLGRWFGQDSIHALPAI